MVAHSKNGVPGERGNRLTRTRHAVARTAGPVPMRRAFGAVGEFYRSLSKRPEIDSLERPTFQLPGRERSEPPQDYYPPRIERLGTVAELTRGGTAGPNDGLGGQGDNGSF